jgi:hypothetical protein
MCDVDENGYVLDMITFEPIVADDRVITIGEGESSKCFDVETVLRLDLNPFTRGEWPAYVREQVNQYARNTTIDWPIRLLSDRLPRFAEVLLSDTLGDALLKIADLITTEQPERVLFYYGTIQLKDGTRARAIHLDLNKTLVELGVDLTEPYIHVYHLANRYPQAGYRAWWPYALAHHLNWLMVEIPEEYQEWYEDELPDEDSYWRLRAELDRPRFSVRRFVDVARSAYITAEQAEELIGLLDHPCTDVLSHVIYARVVDKWHLGGSLLGDAYHRVQGLPADYKVRINLENAIAYCAGVPTVRRR